jgi:glycosyltransferase involved in cell wall biosynthesis
MPAARLDGVRVLVLFGGSELFGQERANIEVFRSLAGRGLKSRFITSSKWGAKQIQPELDRFGLEWTTAPFGYQWTRHMLGKHFGYFLLNLYGVVATSFHVWREAQRWHATHLYAPNWMYWLYASLALRLLRLPLIYRAGDQLPTQTRFHRWVSRKLMRSTERVVCNCEFLRKRFLALGFKPDHLRVIYNSPAKRLETKGREVPWLPPDSLLLLYVGQIAEHKGLPVLVEAAEQLLKAGRRLSLWISGDSMWGRETTVRIQTRVEATGWSQQIRFLGYRTNVAELMRCADIHVCPSVWEEPSPNVVFEAKREGVPSVVFPVGGVPELVEHGVDGYVCKECTVTALVEGIDYFVQDATRREQAGEAARRSLEERFGLERFQRQWADVFQATARKQSSPSK